MSGNPGRGAKRRGAGPGAVVVCSSGYLRGVTGETPTACAVLCLKPTESNT